MDVHGMVEDFLSKWGPRREDKYDEFVDDLRRLLKMYGKAALLHESLPEALLHESLPDTEHEHGDPV